MGDKKVKSAGTKTSRARGSGIPAGGVGWGGPAKGAGKTTPRKNAPTPGPGRGHVSYTVQGETRLERDARMAEEARQFYHLIMHSADEMTANRLNAASKLLDRIEGLPVQKIVQAQQDSLDRMTHEQKLDELSAVQAKRKARKHE